MAAALRRKSVSSQSAPAPRGFTNKTNAFTLPTPWAITCASSPMLARLQGQCGCASIINVGLSVCRGTIDTAGQFEETKPAEPGVISYLNRGLDPKPSAAIQVAPSRVVRKIFLRDRVTITSRAAGV